MSFLTPIHVQIQAKKFADKRGYARIYSLKGRKIGMGSSSFLDRATAQCSGRCAIQASPDSPLWNPNRNSPLCVGQLRGYSHLDISHHGRIDGIGHRKTRMRQEIRRQMGWKSHICVGDTSRLAHIQRFMWMKAESARIPLSSVTRYKYHGITMIRVLTGSEDCYKSWKFRHACQEFGIERKRTIPHHIQSNGNMELFIRITLKDWAYSCTYTHSRKHTQDLPWTYRYNLRRPQIVLTRKHQLPGYLEWEQHVDSLYH